MRRGLVLVMLMLSLASTLVAADACGPLASDTNLTSDSQAGSSTCFTITADDVTLDCKGFLINGTAGANGFAAIRAENVSNITIRDCRVQGFDFGIRFIGVNDSLVENSSTLSTPQPIVVEQGSSRNTFTGGVYNGSGLGDWNDVGFRQNDVSVNNTLQDLSIIHPRGAFMLWNYYTDFVRVNFSAPGYQPYDAAFGASFEDVRVYGGNITYYSDLSHNPLHHCPASIQDISTHWLYSTCSGVPIRNVTLVDEHWNFNVVDASDVNVSDIITQGASGTETEIYMRGVSRIHISNITSGGRAWIRYIENVSLEDATLYDVVALSDVNRITLRHLNASGSPAFSYSGSSPGTGHIITDSVFRDDQVPAATDVAWNVTFVNVTMNRSLLSTATANFSVQWYYTLNLSSTNGSLDDADVTIRDESGAIVYQGLKSALPDPLNLTAFTVNSSGSFDKTYTLTVEQEGYESYSAPFNLTSNAVELVVLGVARVCVQETQECFDTIQEAVDNATAGQTVVITDGGVYNESLTISKSLALTSNSTVMPTVFGRNQTAIIGSGLDISDIELRVEGDASDIHAVSGSNNNLSGVRVWFNTSATYLSGAIHSTTGTTRITESNFTGNTTENRAVQTRGTLYLNASRFNGTAEVFVFHDGTSFLEDIYINGTGAGVNLPGSETVVNATIHSTSYAWWASRDGIMRDSYIYSLSSSRAFDMDDNTRFINSTLARGRTITWAGSVNASIIDSTFLDGGLDLEAGGDGYLVEVSVINSTLTPDRIGMQSHVWDPATAVTFLNPLSVDVTAGGPIAATLRVQDSTSATVASQATGADGHADFNLTYASVAWNGAAQTTWFTNHTVTASRYGYASNTTSVNLSSGQQVALSLRPALNVTFNTTSPGASVTLLEPQSQTFSIVVNNPDGITYNVTWLLDGANVAQGTGTYVYASDYDSAGMHNVTVRLDSEVNTIAYSWNVTVADTAHTSTESSASGSKRVTRGYLHGVNQSDGSVVYPPGWQKSMSGSDEKTPQETADGASETDSPQSSAPTSEESEESSVVPSVPSNASATAGSPSPFPIIIPLVGALGVLLVVGVRWFLRR